MLRTTIYLPFCAFFFLAGNVCAVESGGQRGLQTGPAGEGVAFQTLGRADLEVLMQFQSLSGDERTGDKTRTVSGNTTQLTLANGYAVNENLNFVVELNRASTEISGEETGDQVISSSLTRSHTEISAGPALWAGNILLGAHASIASYGKDKYKEGTSVVTIDSAMIPRVKLFTGIHTESITAAIRSVLYNDARVKRTAYTDDTGMTSKDYKRRSPAETSLDARLVLNEQFIFAGSFTYINAERASDGDKKDYFIVGLAGHHVGADWLTFVGGLRYTEAHYRDTENASIFSDNLGGLRIDIGLHYILQNLTGTFGLGYTIPELLTYRAEGSIQDTKIERALWDLAFGLIMKL